MPIPFSHLSGEVIAGIISFTLSLSGDRLRPVLPSTSMELGEVQNTTPSDDTTSNAFETDGSVVGVQARRAVPVLMMRKVS